MTSNQSRMDSKEKKIKPANQQGTHQSLWEDTPPRESHWPSTGQTHSSTAFWWTSRAAPVRSGHSQCWRNRCLFSGLEVNLKTKTKNIDMSSQSYLPLLTWCKDENALQVVLKKAKPEPTNRIKTFTTSKPRPIIIRPTYSTLDLLQDHTDAVALVLYSSTMQS